MPGFGGLTGRGRKMRSGLPSQRRGTILTDPIIAVVNWSFKVTKRIIQVIGTRAILHSVTPDFDIFRSFGPLARGVLVRKACFLLPFHQSQQPHRVPLLIFRRYVTNALEFSSPEVGLNTLADEPFRDKSIRSPQDDDPTYTGIQH